MIRGMFLGVTFSCQHFEGRFLWIPYTLDGSADGGSCVG